MVLRALVVIATPTLRRSIRAQLIDADAMPIRGVTEGPAVLQQIAGDTLDLLIIEADCLPEPWEQSMATISALPDPPAVVALVDDDEPSARATLLSLGCDTAIEAALPVAQMSDVISAVVARRRARPRRPRRMQAQPSLSDFVSKSPTMQAFMDVVRRVARSRTSLLIEGETGVGKERLARALHADGPRGRSPFVAVNCGALPESLLESELFGHEKGAFTGATRSRRGCFELADGGTLFLDEIGEIPFHLQVKLLRALQEREIVRVGGEEPFSVEVRVIAATNRDLEDEIAAGRFRSDLYYRLNVITLRIPPLRERVEDIPALVENYIEFLAPRIGCDVEGIEPDAIAALSGYAWPGNVRELINVLERSMLLADGAMITCDVLPAGISGAAPPIRPATSPVIAASAELSPELLALPLPEARRAAADRFEEAYLRALLTEEHGRVGAVAQRAGIAPRSLYTRMQRFGLDKRAFKPD